VSGRGGGRGVEREEEKARKRKKKERKRRKESPRYRKRQPRLQKTDMERPVLMRENRLKILG